MEIETRKLLCCPLCGRGLTNTTTDETVTQTCEIHGDVSTVPAKGFEAAETFNPLTGQVVNWEFKP